MILHFSYFKGLPLEYLMTKICILTSELYLKKGWLEIKRKTFNDIMNIMILLFILRSFKILPGAYLLNLHVKAMKTANSMTT